MAEPGEMHPIDKAFYELVIKERDYERVRVNRLEGELVSLKREHQNSLEYIKELEKRLNVGIC